MAGPEDPKNRQVAGLAYRTETLFLVCLGLGRPLYQKPRSGWWELGLDVKEPACYRPSAPRCKYDDKVWTSLFCPT